MIPIPRDKGKTRASSVIGGFNHKAFPVQSGARTAHADWWTLFKLLNSPENSWLTPYFPQFKRQVENLGVMQHVRKVVVMVLHSAEDIEERGIPGSDLIEPS